MDTDDYLAAIDTESKAFIDAVAQNFGGVVEHCDDWPVLGLAVHLGNVWQLATANILAPTAEMARPADPFPKGVAASSEEISEFLSRSRVRMLEALADADPTAPSWSFASDNQTTGFWQRRLAHETAMHRWDAEMTGGSASPIDAALASDGIDEYTTVGLLWSSSRPDRTYPSSSLHLHCTDVEGEWMLVGNDAGDVTVTREHAKGDAAVRGPANDLLLWIWGRPGAVVDIFGDADVASTWRALAP